MKRCSISCVIEEMQIKTRYHYTPIRTIQIQNTENTKCWWGCRASRMFFMLVGMQNGTATLEGSLVISYKTKQDLTMKSKQSHFLLCTQRSWKVMFTQKPTCRCINFIEALFKIAKIWKQPKYPLVGKWINKAWYIQTVEYYSVLRRK